MILNKEHQLYRVDTAADLAYLKSLYVKELDRTLDASFEAEATRSMYHYKFQKGVEQATLRLRLNPYLVFFENQFADKNHTLNKGLCVLYPSTLVTGKTEGHAKFIGNSGALLYAWSKQYEKSSFSVDEVISMFVAILGGVNTEVAIRKMRRIIEMYITDLLLVIE